MKKKIILIGGSPTAGKSYTAEKLAQALKCPWISTDMIREQMREIVRKEDYPSLFLHAKATSRTAVEFLTHNSAEEIVSHQNKESMDVWRGIKAIIKTNYVWKTFIVEGVAILPKLASRLKSKNVLVIFLIDEDIQRIRNTIFTRGLWDDANKYPRGIKEKEIAWVLAFNEYIRKEAKKYGFPVVSMGNRRDYLKKIKNLVK